MKHIFALTLSAAFAAATAAPVLSCDDHPGCRERKSRDDDDVTLRDGGRDTERNADSFLSDYRDRDFSNRDDRSRGYGDQNYGDQGSGDRGCDVRDSRSRNDGRRYEFTRQSDDRRSHDCADGDCAIDACSDCGDRQDGDCSSDAPFRDRRSRHDVTGSGRVTDNRFRLSSRDDFNTDRDFGFPVRRQNSARPAGNGIQWTTGLQRAADIATRENRPMLIQVTADWCPHCRTMKREAYTDSRIIDVLNHDFVTVQIDADRDRAFVEQMKITSLPTTLIVAPNRQIMERVEGARSADHLLNLLQKN